MRKAFTLLEIIFVIVILGILSGVAVFYFRTSDSELVQAKNQLINHIRYTQH
ncbi:MAG: Tfp pilus assembly protein FimT/FimU, partial [Campylobacterales bacterium]